VSSMGEGEQDEHQLQFGSRLNLEGARDHHDPHERSLS
jgi:hypothetical protein